MPKYSDLWKLVITKYDPQGNKIESRISFHVDDEVATDALLAASDAAMEHEVDTFIEGEPDGN